MMGRDLLGSSSLRPAPHRHGAGPRGSGPGVQVLSLEALKSQPSAVVLLVELWSSWWSCGPPGGAVVLLVELWSSWWSCGPPGGALVLLVELWSSWWSCGPPGGALAQRS
ncbi:hypothetical protein EYF80_063110 [Liparis tanakae]|uniref:Uncharacterized protein n=1 Tax=Liparis tanakae TaxID=230148 RepID=A0A4Z2EEN2_9TELE|nr:hypothetical protein EYF80_063110 [Liparis tanakae]